MGSKNLLEDNRSHSQRNCFAITMPSWWRFCSLVGVSIINPELRFINMVLSSAISKGLINSFYKTAITLALRDSDFRICEHRVGLYTSYCSLMLHICIKDFKFEAWSALPMVHLVTASLSAESLLILLIVLASLFSDCSPPWSGAVWRLCLACDWTEKMISSPLCSESLFLIWCIHQVPCLAWLCLLVEK